MRRYIKHRTVERKDNQKMNQILVVLPSSTTRWYFSNRATVPVKSSKMIPMHVIFIGILLSLCKSSSESPPPSTLLRIDCRRADAIMCYQCTECPEPFTEGYPYVAQVNNTNFLAQCTVSYSDREIVDRRNGWSFALLENSDESGWWSPLGIKRHSLFLSDTIIGGRYANLLLRSRLLQFKLPFTFLDLLRLRTVLDSCKNLLVSILTINSLQSRED